MYTFRPGGGAPGYHKNLAMVYALFYMRGVAPKGITTVDIYKAAIPFVLLQLTGLIFCMVFPQFITWLPSMIR